MGKKHLYSVQPNEMAGFIALLDCADFYSEEKKEREGWLELLPQLKDTDFNELVNFMRDEKQSERKRLKTSLMDALRILLPEIHSLEELKEKIAKSPNPDVKPEEIGMMIDSVYPIYQEFFHQYAPLLKEKGEEIAGVLNEHAQDSLERVAHFYKPGYHLEEQIEMYIFPNAVKGLRGQNLKNTSGCKQWIAIGQDRLMNPDSIDKGQCASLLYHEKVHGVFKDTGARDWLREYLNEDNPIVKKLNENPELKRNPNVSDESEAGMMVDEALTSAFQGILEEQVRGHVPDVLYSNHVINIMAHRAIPLVKEALKSGETFGLGFMKKFEQEFVSSLEEMKEQVHKQKVAESLGSCLSDGKQSGENLEDTKSKQQISLLRDNQHT